MIIMLLVWMPFPKQTLNSLLRPDSTGLTAYKKCFLIRGRSKNLFRSPTAINTETIHHHTARFAFTVAKNARKGNRLLPIIEYRDAFRHAHSTIDIVDVGLKLACEVI